MKNMLSLKNELTMSSTEIAELAGKQIGHIHRDIKTQLIEGLHEIATKDDPNLDHIDIKGIFVVHDNRGYIKQIDLNREHTLTLMTGYDVKARHAINKRWLELEASVKPVMTLEQMTLAVIQGQQQKIAEMEAQALLDKPKVKFAEVVTESGNTRCIRAWG